MRTQHARRTTWLAFVLLAPLTVWAGDPPPQAKAKPKDDGPKVLTAQEAAEKLRPAGSDRYGPGSVDWRNVPPWRQTSFFGVRAQGQTFIYVVDCSGSMAEDARLVRAKAELRRAVLGLRFPQRFKVIFYNEVPLPMPGDALKSADWASKDQFFNWLNVVEPDGRTDPRGAMKLALSLKPDAVFLLSDGEFPEGAAEAIAKANPRKVPVHCIDLSGGTGGDDLQRIAADSGGQYVSRP